MGNFVVIVSDLINVMIPAVNQDGALLRITSFVLSSRRNTFVHCHTNRCFQILIQELLCINRCTFICVIVYMKASSLCPDTSRLPSANLGYAFSICRSCLLAYTVVLRHWNLPGKTCHMTRLPWVTSQESILVFSPLSACLVKGNQNFYYSTD
jgi:hypothetical protein